MFRSRDVVAVIFAVILSQQAWNRQESLSATVHLAFYLPRKQSRYDPVRPAILDVNGDGIPEALVDIAKYDQQGWQVRVLDIALNSDRAGGAFQAPVVVESSVIPNTYIQPPQLPVHKDSGPLEPLAMTVGHVIMADDPRGGSSAAKKDKPNKKSAKGKGNVELTERNRKFFCGSDWHDASRKCETPCPSGMSTDCPDGETCYADTPCEHYYDEDEADETKDPTESIDMVSRLTDVNNVTHQYHLTPAGGLPSVVTLWSNGVVTLHSVAAAKTDNKSTSRKKKESSTFEVQLMWRTRILPAKKLPVDWQEQTIKFVDAISADNGSGLILVSGSLELGDDGEDSYPPLVPILVAIHARTGHVVWRSIQDDENGDGGNDEEQEQPILPLQRGSTSMARRRSRIPNLHHDANQNKDGGWSSSSSQQHCLRSFFRRPLLSSSTLERDEGALPFSYWTESDASIRTLHFDLEQPKPSEQGGKSKSSSLEEKKKAAAKKHKHKRHHHRHLMHFGKPNVIVTHDMTGIQVRSLRNGRSLCHLSLSEETLYADFNHDGTLDSLQLAMGYHTVPDLEREADMGEDADDDYRFIAELARRMAKKEVDKSSKSGDKNKRPDEERMFDPVDNSASLCHLVALSGFPSKEELFSANLCGNKRDSGGLQLRKHHVVGAPPLLVEPMYGRGWDVIAAVSTGMVQRIRGRNGWRQWKLDGNYQKDFPHWQDTERVRLGRVESYNVIPGTRPIVLVGDDALSVISVQTGTVLASAKLPQPAIQRAMLVDFDGDGTTDVLVQSREALWGHKIVVRTGSSVFLRILVGLLLMGLLLAMLRNRYGPHPGKRSTDL